MTPTGVGSTLLLLLSVDYTIDANRLAGCNIEEFTESIRRRDFSKARFIGQESRCSRKQLSNTYLKETKVVLSADYHAVLGVLKPTCPVDSQDCWNWNLLDDGYPEMDSWSKCCSQLSRDDDQPSLEASGFFDVKSSDTCWKGTRRLCCDFYQGSSSYLFLPLLHELALRVVVSDDSGEKQSMDLQQDGFLRPYDTSGVLWPTGYMLSLCVSAPQRCGIPQLLSADSTIELGVGIGAASVALSRRGVNVIACDKALHALALTEVNAAVNNVSTLTTRQLDHFNMIEVQNLANEFRQFDVVLGSSLQSLFDETTSEQTHQLWSILDTLLKADGVAVLAHSIYTLQIPAKGNFEMLHKISAGEFDMYNRQGTASDFEITVVKRKTKRSDEF